MGKLTLICAWICVAALAAWADSDAPTVRIQFREPQVTSYEIESDKLSNTGDVQELEARGDNASVQITARVTLQLNSAADLKKLLAGSALKLDRTVAPGTFILQARNAAVAIAEAQRLSKLAEVSVAVPVMRRARKSLGAYFYKPNDPYSFNQWHLEHRNQDGSQAGIDLNVRAAWPFTRGRGVIVGVADEGVELWHPELAARTTGMPHYDFVNDTTNGAAIGDNENHGTPVAGLIAAELNNHLGGSGVAPLSQIASWKIATNGSYTATDEQMMDMFQYYSNSVAVQNHSWGLGGDQLLGPSLLEKIGISNAWQFGRSGLGSVMVRAGGNDRSNGANVNDDGFPADSHVIAVGAARFDGRVASYSNPGACLLVAAPSGDTGYPTLFTTDRIGTNGYNTLNYTNDPTLADYCFDASGFTGTSAAAPEVSGIAALILSANPNLSYRDVQQILMQSSRHFDFADPDLMTNAAGFRVSHNQGYGVPDAGFAVALARQWSNRPPLTTVMLVATNSFTTNTPGAIPDDGLRVLVNDGVTNVMSIPSSPDLGLTIDSPTPLLPLIDVGQALSPISQSLTNKIALIQRGGSDFSQKILYAANAGALYAIIYNNQGATDRVVMGATDFSPIPAVFIGKNNGDALHNLLLTNASASAQLTLFSTNYTFLVTNTLLCEHVSVRLQTDHTRRADVRITLVSPNGVRSVLDKLNNDVLSAGPVDWTYSSTHHFYESSYGAWTLCVSDEAASATGSVKFASLTIDGVSITDTDHDGLDDNWEMANFNSLAFGPKDDPDKDGYNNMREQIMGTNPNVPNPRFQLNLSRWDTRLARLSWPGSSNLTYEVRAGRNVATLSVLTNVVGQFPQTELFTSYTNSKAEFFEVRSVSNP